MGKDKDKDKDKGKGKDKDKDKVTHAVRERDSNDGLMRAVVDTCIRFFLAILRPKEDVRHGQHRNDGQHLFRVRERHG